MSHRELEMDSILGPEMEVDLVCLRNSVEAGGQRPGQSKQGQNVRRWDPDRAGSQV